MLISHFSSEPSSFCMQSFLSSSWCFWLGTHCHFTFHLEMWIFVSIRLLIVFPSSVRMLFNIPWHYSHSQTGPWRLINSGQSLTLAVKILIEPIFYSAPFPPSVMDLSHRIPYNGQLLILIYIIDFISREHTDFDHFKHFNHRNCSEVSDIKLNNFSPSRLHS